MNLSGEEGSPSPVPAAGQAEGPRLIFGREPQVTAALRPGLGLAPSGWGEAKALVRTAQSGTSSHSGQGWGPLQATINLWLKTPPKTCPQGGQEGRGAVRGWLERSGRRMRSGRPCAGRQAQQRPEASLGGSPARGVAPRHPPCAPHRPHGSLVHRGRLVALGGLGVLAERRLLVGVHRRAGVGRVGRAGVRGGVRVVLDEVVHPGLVALVGQRRQQALRGARGWVLSPPFTGAPRSPAPKDTRPLAAGPPTHEKMEKKLKVMAARAESAPTSTS